MLQIATIVVTISVFVHSTPTQSSYQYFLPTSAPQSCLQNHYISPITLQPSQRTLARLLQHCCDTDDGIRRDCCALVYPDIPAHKRCCFCSQKPIRRNPTTTKTIIKVNSTESSDRSMPLRPDTEKLLRKCYYAEHGGSLDCLRLAFPTTPWHRRQPQLVTNELDLEDLLFECCNADDGVTRDCCGIVYPGQRWACPCQGRRYAKNPIVDPDPCKPLGQDLWTSCNCITFRAEKTRARTNCSQFLFPIPDMTQCTFPCGLSTNLLKPRPPPSNIDTDVYDYDM